MGSELVVSLRVTRDNNLLRFVRDLEKQQSRLVVDKYTHYIPTWSMSFEELERRIAPVKEKFHHDPKLRSLGVRFIGPIPFARTRKKLSEYSPEELSLHRRVGGRFVYIARGPPEMKQYLPEMFIGGSVDDQRNNVQRMAEVIDNFPFSTLPDHKKVPPLSLLRQRKAVFDTEWRNAPAYDELFAIGYFTNDGFGNYILMTDESPVSSLRVETPFGSFLFNVVDRLGSPRKLSEYLTRLIHDHDPLFLVAQNMSFDAYKLKELGGFFPGVPYESSQGVVAAPPRHTLAGFLRMVRTDGRIVFDPFPFFQKRSWTRNNKLDTLLKCVLPGLLPQDRDLRADLGSLLKDFGSYDELERAAQSRDPRDVRRWMEYLALDCIKPFLFVDPAGLLGDDSLRESPLLINVLLSYVFGVAPERMVWSGDDQLLVDADERRRLRSLHTYSDTRLPSSHGVKGFDLRVENRSLFPKGFQYGSFHAQLVFVSPYLSAFEEIFTRGDDSWRHVVADASLEDLLGDSFDVEDVLSSVYAVYQKMSDPKMKVMIAQGLESFVKKAVYDVQNLLSSWEENPRALEAVRRLQDDPSFDLSSFDVRVRAAARELGMAPEALFSVLNTDWYFQRIYGVRHGHYPRNRSVQFFADRLAEESSFLKRFFEDHPPLNYQRRFVVLPRGVDVSPLVARRSALVLGDARVLSLAPRRYVALLDGDVDVFSEGFLLLDPSSEKGYTVPAEKAAALRFVQEYLSSFDRDAAFGVLSSFIDRVKRVNDLPLDERLDFLFMVKRLARNYFEYRERAHFLERVHYIVRHGKLKGDSFMYGYVSPDVHGVDMVPYPGIVEERYVFDIPRYLSFFFGPVKSGRYSFSRGLGLLAKAVFGTRDGRYDKKLLAGLSEMLV